MSPLLKQWEQVAGASVTGTDGPLLEAVSGEPLGTRGLRVGSLPPGADQPKPP